MPTYFKTSVTRDELAKVSEGVIPADIVLRGGKLVNVASGEIYPVDIAVKGERIAAVGDVSHTIGKGTQIVDISGMFVTPGLIDGHIHIESSMLTIDQFSSLVVPHGTTVINADSHEIANVLGMRGFKFFYELSGKVPLRVLMGAPSSVPISDSVEVPSSRIGLDDIEEMMKWERVLGLSEILNIEAIMSGSEDLAEKIQIALRNGKFIDGNAAGIGGRQLNTYIASGPQHDHEALTAEEAKERLRLGMWVMLREGSSERNLKDIIGLVASGNLDTRRFAFATDDKDASDLFSEGHLDHDVRKAISLGVKPITAIQMATINCAEYLGLERELGSVAPGKLADFLVVGDLERFNVVKTIIGGKIVAENGRMVAEIENENEKIEKDKTDYPRWATETFNMARKIEPQDIELRTNDNTNEQNSKVRVRVIDVSEGTIISKSSEAVLDVRDEIVEGDLKNDILKIVVVERYGRTNIAIGKGFIKGFGLQKGAIASSIAHDTHNIICVGTNDADIVTAVNRVAEIQGGLVAANSSKVVGELKLTLAGIMSLDPWEKVSADLKKLHEIVYAELECRMKSPFMVLAFQSSASIPELKVSTLGLIDMPSMRLVPLFLD